MTVVDGAHAPVYIPLNVSGVNADFYTGNLHKWLLAPSGAGFLVIGSGNEDRLQPLHVSWGYHPDQYPIGELTRSAGPDARDNYGSTSAHPAFGVRGHSGHLPLVGGAGEAIDFQTALGFDNVRGRIAELGAYTRKVIGGTGWPLATSPRSARDDSILSYRLRHGIAPALRKWNCGRRAWRFRSSNGRTACCCTREPPLLHDGSRDRPAGGSGAGGRVGFGRCRSTRFAGTPAATETQRVMRGGLPVASAAQRTAERMVSPWPPGCSAKRVERHLPRPPDSRIRMYTRSFESASLMAGARKAHGRCLWEEFRQWRREAGQHRAAVEGVGCR